MALIKRHGNVLWPVPRPIQMLVVTAKVRPLKDILVGVEVEATRTRSSVAQAHTSEWLGTFGAPGNGTAGADLQRACGIIGHYLQHHQLPGQAAIVRLDGYYGTPGFVNQIQQHQLGYLLRCRDYQLLRHQAIQTRLQETPAQQWSHPECHQVREVFDLGFVEDTWAGYSLPVCLIVMRTPSLSERKHRVGKLMGDFVYELFITSHSPVGLSGCDILSLYDGRGGFEKLLSDEDVEQECDQWCSWQPNGQEFWQVLSQWVWDWRLWAGLADQPQAVRQIIWVPAVTEPLDSDTTATALDEALVLSQVQAPCPSADAADYGPMQVAGAWARSRGKFAGADFTLLDERTLQCPAGNAMCRREVRQSQLGDLLILFGINPRTCQRVSLKSQCLADGSKGSGGRRITVIRRKLSNGPMKAQPVASLDH
ncbi:hypothetical protein H6F90_11210 [Trichocoleus sp. FACHB-591]|uniref:hypothetical protein n=1 Tax=Trichocoleus sp. FACHB-591 TaxID=2692872 RepID=UPI0019A8B8C5|nr:hypothetical protein [Trichocoleus sp. FACHB-591]MBD2095721.1 hypothetical protein [Trichocoleus sp. FACHB-591]